MKIKCGFLFVVGNVAISLVQQTRKLTHHFCYPPLATNSLATECVLSMCWTEHTIIQWITNCFIQELSFDNLHFASSSRKQLLSCLYVPIPLHYFSHCKIDMIIFSLSASTSFSLDFPFSDWVIFICLAIILSKLASSSVTLTCFPTWSPSSASIALNTKSAIFSLFLKLFIRKSKTPSFAIFTSPSCFCRLWIPLLAYFSFKWSNLFHLLQSTVYLGIPSYSSTQSII